MRRLVMTGWQSVLWQAAAISLASTAILWGAALSPSRTVSAEALGGTVLPICRASPHDFSCQASYRSAGHSDPAPAWCEIPLDYFYAREQLRTGKLPAWNFYMGSGYPSGLDSHHGRYSPTRWFLRHHLSDQGRDVLVVARVFVWVLGTTLCLLVAGGGIWIALLCGMAAGLAPFLAGSIDSIALDIDILYPWFFLLLLAQARGQTRGIVIYPAAAAIGVWVGLCAFHQSQCVFLVASTVTALLAVRATKGRSLFAAAALAMGFLVTFPSWLPLLRNLDEFVSGRSVICMAGFHRLGIHQFLRDTLFATRAEQLVGTLGGFFLMARSVRAPGSRFPLAAYAGFGLTLIFGAPWLCAIPGVSAARFGRHLALPTQFLFLYGVATAASRLGSWREGLPIVVATLLLSWIPAILGGAGALVTLNILASGVFFASFALRTLSAAQPLAITALLVAVLSGFVTSTDYWKSLIAGELPPEQPGYALEHPKGSLWEKVEQRSRDEDRRHYSPTEALYPNWGAAFGVLDFRLIAPLIPRAFHGVNAALFDRWFTHPFHLLHPDRFVRPESKAEMFHPDLFRVLLLHRVSLFTLPAADRPFPRIGGPYDPERCRAFARDSSTTAIACDGIGGIGFFPATVTHVSSHQQALHALKQTTLETLGSFAVVEKQSEEPSLGPGRGRVLSVARGADELSYELEVEEPGTFVIAENWFAGWTATVNDIPAPLLRANVAFKAVEIPIRGTVRVRLAFHLR